MPYNTRRKSLSLPALGIQLPNASRAHRPSPTKSTNASEINPPPAKKAKRSHASSISSSLPVTPSRPRSSTASSSTKSVTFARPPTAGRNAYEHTPPPSPGAETETKIDTEGINDDIVIGVIEQLEKTGNRPHLIKELAAVLSTTRDSVQSSANPGALLSSRLAAYLRRSCWTALSPCPLAKELIPIHPRKVYYFLTTTKRQEIPIDSLDISLPLMNGAGGGGKGGKRIISPSLSSASIDEDLEGGEHRKREALSPSPEIDLSAPELDSALNGAEDDFAPPTPAGSFSNRSSLARDGSSGSSTDSTNLNHNHRSAPPDLENDEKEFENTASSLRIKGMNMDELNIRQSKEVDITSSHDATSNVEESEEEKAKRNSEAAADLFGGQHQHVRVTAPGLMSSPLVKAVHAPLVATLIQGAVDVEREDEAASIMGGDRGMDFSWDIGKPENVDLDELDDLFGAY